MNYIITENAIEISKELFKLGVPTDLENSLFGTVTHENGETALQFSLDENVLIHPNFDVSKLIELTDYTQEQQLSLQAYFNDVKINQFGKEPESGFVLGRFPFENIVVGYAEIKDQEYMEVNGWFPNEEEIN
tara:strand:+ start:7652 stop:8047 length:396 start_codon:yes stop_codon:yes gene_type:complete